MFKALADAGRRDLLDSLRSRDGRTLRELCAVLPDLTRFGVMKHLGVLEHAGLLTTHRTGRTKEHYLNPVPIQAIHDRWISQYAAPFAAAMLGLRDRAEAEQEQTAVSERVFERANHQARSLAHWCTAADPNPSHDVRVHQ